MATMNEYEITYVSNGTVAEEARVQLDNEVEEKIRALEGVIQHASAHTPRRLFYPVKKQRTAGLRNLHIELAPDKLSDLQTFLKKHASILRATILRTPRRAEVPPTIVEQLRGSRSRTGTPVTKKPVRSTPAKPVTEEDVEKGIEKALSEEVK